MERDKEKAQEIEAALVEFLQKDILFNGLIQLLERNNNEALVTIDGNHTDREKQSAIDERKGYNKLKDQLVSLRNSGTS